MGNGNSYGEDIELKGIGALDIHEDAHVVAYLQTNEILVCWLTPKQWDQAVQRAKWLKCEGNSLL